MHFAQELIDYICQNLEHDTATLVACSQTSLSWLWASRRVQFRSLDLSACHVSRLEYDLAFLESATFILPNVIRVAVRLRPVITEQPPNEVTLQLWHIERILSLLPNTRQLQINAQHIDGSSLTKTSCPKRGFQLETLSLCGFHYHNANEVEGLAAFFSLFATIVRLKLFLFGLDNPPLYPNAKFIELLKRFSIPSIEHLSFYRVSLGTLHYFAYATRTHPAKSLKYSDQHLKMGDTDGPIVVEILKACAGKLEAVSILSCPEVGDNLGSALERCQTLQSLTIFIDNLVRTTERPGQADPLRPLLNLPKSLSRLHVNINYKNHVLSGVELQDQSLLNGKLDRVLCEIHWKEPVTFTLPNIYVGFRPEEAEKRAHKALVESGLSGLKNRGMLVVDFI